MEFFACLGLDASWVFRINGDCCFVVDCCFDLFAYGFPGFDDTVAPLWVCIRDVDFLWLVRFCFWIIM